MSQAFHNVPAGIKIAAQVTPEPTPEELDFIRQMGVEYVVLWTNADKASEAYYSSRKKLFAEAGLQVYGFGNASVHNQDAIVLGLPYQVRFGGDFALSQTIMYVFKNAPCRVFVVREPVARSESRDESMKRI